MMCFNPSVALNVGFAGYERAHSLGNRLSDDAPSFVSTSCRLEYKANGSSCPVHQTAERGSQHNQTKDDAIPGESNKIMVADIT